MKKEILSFGAVLSREEQQKINGGGGTCAACQHVGYASVQIHGGDPFADEKKVCLSGYTSGVSIEEAQSHVQSGGHWCCDSCSSASWYTPPSISLFI